MVSSAECSAFTIKEPNMLNNKKLRIAALVLGASAAVMSAPSFAQRGGMRGPGPQGPASPPPAN